MVTKKNVVFTALIGIIILSSTFSFADLQVRNVTFEELTSAAIAKNTNLNALKDAEKTLASAINSLGGAGTIYVAMGTTIGTTNERNSYYYRYIKPIQLGKLQYETQLMEVQTNEALIETTVKLSLSKTIRDLDTMEQQVELYGKTIIALEEKHKLMNDRLQKGLVTKFQAYGVETQLNQTRFALNKLNWHIKNVKSQLASQGNLKAGLNYSFELPTESTLKFNPNDFPMLFSMAKQTNTVIAIEKAKVETLEQEGRYISEYKELVWASDVIDYEQRLTNGKNNLIQAENMLYVNLKNLLNDLKNAQDEILKTELQLQLARLDHRIAQTSNAQKVILSSDLVDYELAINGLELMLLSQNSKETQLLKRIDMLVNFGAYIAQ